MDSALKQALFWLDCKRGATAIEYGLIAGGIAVAIMAIVFLIGGKLLALFQFIAAMLPGG